MSMGRRSANSTSDWPRLEDAAVVEVDEEPAESDMMWAHCRVGQVAGATTKMAP
jgi:hypothetical protein